MFFFFLPSRSRSLRSLFLSLSAASRVMLIQRVLRYTTALDHCACFIHFYRMFLIYINAYPSVLYRVTSSVRQPVYKLTLSSNTVGSSLGMSLGRLGESTSCELTTSHLLRFSSGGYKRPEGLNLSSSFNNGYVGRLSKVRWEKNRAEFVTHELFRGTKSLICGTNSRWATSPMNNLPSRSLNDSHSLKRLH